MRKRQKNEPQTRAVAQLTVAGQEELFILGQVRLHFGLLPTSPAQWDEQMQKSRQGNPLNRKPVWTAQHRNKVSQDVALCHGGLA